MIKLQMSRPWIGESPSREGYMPTELSSAYEMRMFYFTKTKMMLGKEHSDTLTSMHNLAEVLSKQGNCAEGNNIGQIACTYGHECVLPRILATPKETVQGHGTVVSPSMRWK